MTTNYYQQAFLQFGSHFDPSAMWVLCSDCRSLTRRDSPVAWKWWRDHSRCSSLRFLHERPEGRFELVLGGLEALASLGDPHAQPEPEPESEPEPCCGVPLLSPLPADVVAREARERLQGGAHARRAALGMDAGDEGV